MKRFALLLVCAALLSSAGCCWHQPSGCGYGGGCNTGCGYGANYAPVGGCPTGNCGTTYPGTTYPSGGYYPSGAYMGGATTAYAPYGYTTATLDPLPTY